MQMIKGGGGALTREKILSVMAKKFICIVDESKQVDFLGKFPLPIEIIPISFSYISKEIANMKGIPKYRNNVITDNGNIIIDVYNLNITDPVLTEQKINSLPGVVTVGLFTTRVPDIVIVGTKNGIKTIKI